MNVHSKLAQGLFDRWSKVMFKHTPRLRAKNCSSWIKSVDMEELRESEGHSTVVESLESWPNDEWTLSYPVKVNQGVVDLIVGEKGTHSKINPSSKGFEAVVSR